MSDMETLSKLYLELANILPEKTVVSSREWRLRSALEAIAQHSCSTPSAKLVGYDALRALAREALKQ